MKKSRMRSEASSSNNKNSRGETVVVDCGRRKSSCGYCRSPVNTSISHGLWAHSITVDDYQDLLDRGWRRSGSLLYKPEMERTCCPAYTIRLKASDFVPSKEQLKVYRRTQRFLDGTLDQKKSCDHMDVRNTSQDTCSSSYQDLSSAGSKTISNGSDETKKEESVMHYLSEQINNAVLTCIGSGEFASGIQLPKASVKKVIGSKRKNLTKGSEELSYSSNIAFQIAATLRRAQSTMKDVSQLRGLGNKEEENASSPVTVADKLASSMNQVSETYGLFMRACNGHLNFYSVVNDSLLNQGVPPASTSKEPKTNRKNHCLSKGSQYPELKRRKLEIRLKRSSFDPKEFALYKSYQVKVHNDEPDQVTESSYRRFLVDTPLVFVPHTGDNKVPPCGFGSFHQQYVIDGQLVAVGVIDILPKCLSSKYLFWDPDYAFLSLGKHSALQELGWVKENETYCPSLQYYYLGYYIHSCNKMRYKAAYRPSELLCPLRYEWVSFDIARPLLDRKSYVILSDLSNLQSKELSAPPDLETVMDHEDTEEEDSNDIRMDDVEEVTEDESENSDDEPDSETNGDDVTNILIGLKGSRLKYEDLQRVIGKSEKKMLESQLRKYQKVVGPELSERVVYSLG